MAPRNSRSPGVAHALFDLSDSEHWKIVERAFGSQVVLPGQLPNNDNDDVIDARKLALALVVQAVRDVEECFERRQGLRSSETLAFGGDADEREIVDWFFQDSYMEAIPIESPTIPPTEEIDAPRFISVPQGQTLHLTQHADGVYSFTGCCALLGISAAGARRILKRWIQHREAGGTEALISDGTAAAARKRAFERRRAIQQRQLAAFQKAGYPIEVQAAALGISAFTVRVKLRALSPPKPKKAKARREPKWDAARCRCRQARLWHKQGLPRPVIASILGFSRTRLADVLRK